MCWDVSFQLHLWQKHIHVSGPCLIKLYYISELSWKKNCKNLVLSVQKAASPKYFCAFIA